MADILNAIESPITTIGTTFLDDTRDVFKSGLNDISQLGSGVITQLMLPMMLLGGGYILITQMTNNRRY